MDFRYKANMWVGNMFQKFEAACHEMDNIMNQVSPFLILFAFSDSIF